MKVRPFVMLMSLVYAAAASAQTVPETARPAYTFEIGSRIVRIPSPEGFTKIGRRHGRVLSVQEASEPSTNEIVAVHLPTDQLPKFKTGSDRQPDFFTKVSISRIGRDEDITPESFLAVGSFIEKEFAKLTNPRGRALLAEQHYVSKNLSELLNSRTDVKWDQPVNLGVFDKSDSIHSTLTLISLSANNTPYKFLGTVSFDYVNMRLIYVYVYKSNPVGEDLEMIREFTRKWTASIVDANRETTAKHR
jgi:hypothetical protein